MHLAAREIPDQPSIHGTEQKFAILRPLACASDMIEYPFDLGSRKIGINDEPGILADVWLKPSGLQVVANSRRAATLPDDGVIDRLAACLFPDNSRFTLIGDADRGHFVGTNARLFKNLPRHATLASPDIHRIVFYPLGLPIDLCNLFLGDINDFPVLIEQDGTGTCRSLIESQYIFLGHDYRF